jgi:DNA repair exonuclease SbcCD nuclease subunit
MNKPTAVLISDIHYNIYTLSLADAALRQAITKANELGVHLIVAGDMHDSKANLRGECVKAMIETIQLCNITPIIIRGNHDQINEKSEEHSLEFLRPYAYIVDKPNIYRGGKTQTYEYCIPYQSDLTAMQDILSNIPKGSRIIMHQGLQNSLSGEYIQDKTAIPNEWAQDYRVISGHYHTRQDIKTGRPKSGAVGLYSYIGNPYTLNFAEANDPEKGFQILMDDGTLEFVPTNLRKHLVIEENLITNSISWSSTPAYYTGDRKDIIWAKIIGTKEHLSAFNKDEWCRDRGIVRDIKLTLMPASQEASAANTNLSQQELLDSMIDSLTSTSNECKARLKNTWKRLCE